MELFNEIDNKLTYDVRTIKPKHLPQTDVVKQFKKQSFWDITNTFYRNINHDVYFRPEKLQYILVDLDDAKIENINKAKKLNALLIVQTSQACYQAWFYCPQVRTKDDYVKTARYLTTILDGDMGATQSYQIGRLPNYNNKKKGRNNFLTKIIYKNTKDYILKFTEKQLRAMDSLLKFKPQTKPQKQEKQEVKGSTPRSQVESNPMPIHKKYDWYLLNKQKRKKPNSTKFDYIRILENDYIGDIPKSYILRTVNNFIK